MEIHGIRLGRKMDGRLVISAATTAGGILQIVPMNERRVSLAFFPNGFASYYLSTDPGITPQTGIFAGGNVGPLLLTIDKYGELVKRAWYAFTGSSIQIAWSECSLDGNPLDT